MIFPGTRIKPIFFSRGKNLLFPVVADNLRSPLNRHGPLATGQNNHLAKKDFLNRLPAHGLYRTKLRVYLATLQGISRYGKSGVESTLFGKRITGES